MGFFSGALFKFMKSIMWIIFLKKGGFRGFNANIRGQNNRLFVSCYVLPPGSIHALHAVKRNKGMSDKLLPLVIYKPQRNSHFALIMTDDNRYFRNITSSIGLKLSFTNV